MSFATCVFYLLGGALCLQCSYAATVAPCLQIACKCPHGTTWVTDSEGCTSCSCLPAPADCPKLECVEKMCPYGFEIKDNCRTCNCNLGIECSDVILTPDSCPDGTSLTTDEHGCTICQKNTIHCPILPCPKICCPHGIRKDSNGCRTCECNPPKCPEIGCPRPEDCPGVQKTEYFTDEQGCLKCSCICPAPICKELRCTFGLQTNSAGCPICKCKTSDCPKVECLLECPREFQVDENGCKLCQCKSDVTTASVR